MRSYINLRKLGHTRCGAVTAAMEGGDHGCVNAITDKIKVAIGEETDQYAASVLNVRASIATLESCEQLMKLAEHDGL